MAKKSEWRDKAAICFHFRHFVGTSDKATSSHIYKYIWLQKQPDLCNVSGHVAIVAEDKSVATTDGEENVT